MVRSRASSQGGSQGFEMERKYSVPSNADSRAFSGAASEDLHAWSIYRQNLNSDFTDSALGSADKSPLPYGNFQLRDTTVQSILTHPRYGPKSALGSNMYTYLKFGLPRVFPPNHSESNRSGTPQHFNKSEFSRAAQRPQKHPSRNPRDGSSGYDSSDNETNQYKNNRKYRSDPDFRMQNVHPSYHHQEPHRPNVPLAALHQEGIHSPTNWNRNKSVSEANLLMTDYGRPYQQQPSANYLVDRRRNSVAVGYSHDFVDHVPMNRPKKAGSQISIPVSKMAPSVVRSDYMGPDEDTTYIYPHLQVINLGLLEKSGSCLGSKQQLLINEVSFEARGGEILAVMATSEKEGTAILDTLAGKRRPLLGDVILNGHHVTSSSLRNRVAYVQSDVQLCKTMTVMQTLRFHYDLVKPTEKLDHLKIEAVDKINVLIEDLGLEQVKNTRVSGLTISEQRRLNVACHLLLDTDIVSLDQPTRGMDIFDTFFLVEYLRQWANGGSGNALGRIVILTLHPPTYEIFTMLSRIVLISAGRTMYSGRRRDMLSYFTRVDYPCPSFKNPSDYYLDLVTLDDLSAEAMLESSQRIEQLAEIFRQKQEPMSDPGPPSALPMTVRHANTFSQIFILFMKFMFYTQPITFVNWLSVIVLSTSLSLIIGAVFWDVPNTDPQLNLNDRLGYHYAVTCVASWPILLALTLIEIRRNQKSVERDIRYGLYGKLTYIFAKIVTNLPPSLFVWLLYLIPSYSMCGLYMQSSNDYNGFYIYLGVMLLHLICVQTFLTAFIYLVPGTKFSVILSAIFIAAFGINSGYTTHYKDLNSFVSWIEYISPTTWIFPYLVNREYSQEAITSSSIVTLCRNKQVQHQDIIVQLPCPPPNGTEILEYFGYLPQQNHFNDYNNPIISMVVFLIVSFFVTIFAFGANCSRYATRKLDRNVANKP